MAAVSAPMSPSNSAPDELPNKVEEVKEALTPPASEEHNKRERSDSDLSDLPPEFDDDGGEIEPDHYFDGGKIPVFKPTANQFRDFKKFIDKVDKYGMKSGIVKVIPPKEWRDNLPALDEMVKMIKVKNPITQEFHGSQGTWTQANMEKQRTYNLPQWRALCEESNHQPPARRGERRRNQENGRNARATTTRTAKAPAPPPPAGQKRGRGRPRKNPVPTIEAKEENTEVDADASTQEAPVTPSQKSKAKGDGGSDGEATPKTKGRQPKSVSSRRLRNKGEQNEVIDEESFKDFDYRIHDQDQWTVERCKELETAYWKSLTFNNPMYGADMPGSLFDESTTSWNVAKLPNLLDVLGQKVPGVNTAYLYLGMWKATFAWHLEDVDLYSINYIHFGAPKQWYSISQDDARRFEKAMQHIWPTDAKNCDQFLRHKTYLISPHLLKSQFNIQVNRLVHYEGEFVITYPYGYHSGYNLGYNCAESVNFANEAWLDYGKVAKKCNCEADSVWIDVYDIERRLRGEQTPEFYETEEDDEEDEDAEEEGAGVLPTPPGSVKGHAKAKSRKRKRDASDKGDKSKAKKKIRIKISAPAKEPCCLCPHDPPFEDLLPTDTKTKAHRRCALYTPETRIAEVDGVEVVCDVALIDKARLDLKCNHCRSKRGSVFQCSQRKCTRAYHATCAIAAGVQVDSGQVPVFLEDGSEYTELGHDFRCRFHRPRRPKYNNDQALCVTTLEADHLIRKTASRLKRGDPCQAQYFLGDIFGGYVLENRKEEETLLIDVYPKRDHVEVEYKWLLALDPAQSQLPQPSPDAKPLPVHLMTSAKTNDDPSNEIPKMDDEFGIGSHLKWAEFHTSRPARNPETAKVNFERPKSLWFYLGATSTEAKAQYTGDLATRQHDAASNFLDTVRPPPARAAATRPSYPSSYPSGVNTNALNAVRASMNLQAPRPIQGSTKNILQPYSQRPSFASGQIDTDALRNQQAFLQSAARGQSSSAIVDGESSTKLPDVYRRPSQPASSIEPVRKFAQDAFQPLRPQLATGRPNGLPALQPRQSPAQPTLGVSDKMSPPHRPVFSRSPSAQPQPLKSNNLLTPPSTSDSGNGSRIRSDSLKSLEKWPFIHAVAAQRPAVYHSPYSGSGGYTDAAFVSDYAMLPAVTPQNRSRSTSLMQDFLQKVSPSQREAVRGHARTISTDKAVAKAREAERRMSESIQRQARLSGGAMSPIDMSEGLLGPNLGRPGSSSVISDRASPFPEFELGPSHGHPSLQANSSNDLPAGTINLAALDEPCPAKPSSASQLPGHLNLATVTLDDVLHIHRPANPNTLNHHMPHVYYSTDDQFTAQLQAISSQYPMGTRPSSYNNYMRDLHAAAGTDLNLRTGASSAAKDHPVKDKPPGSAGGDRANSSFAPMHPSSIITSREAESALRSPVELKKRVTGFGNDMSINANGIRGDGTTTLAALKVDPALGEPSDDIASPLKDSFGGTGVSTLPVMSQDAFVDIS